MSRIGMSSSTVYRWQPPFAQRLKRAEYSTELLTGPTIGQLWGLGRQTSLVCDQSSRFVATDFWRLELDRRVRDREPLTELHADPVTQRS